MMQPLALSALVFCLVGSAQGQSTDSEASGEKRGGNLVELPADYVRYARVPEGGTLPRLVRGAEGLALIYFTGEASAGDLHLTRSSDEAKTFTPSQRLNPIPGTVSASDGIHTGAIDLGPDGRAHMAWISNEEKPRLFYTRDTVEGALGEILDLGTPRGLCGNAAVAVDAESRVYLFYAAKALDQGGDDEAKSRIWFRRSSDGVEFTAPVTVDRDVDGVSDRSMLAAHVDAEKGTVFALYRQGFRLRPDKPGMARGMRLLSSVDHGETFDPSPVDNHKQQRDPASRAELSQEKSTTLACWAGSGSVFWSLIRRNLNQANLPVEPKPGPDVLCSQPSAAANDSEILMAWIERPKGDSSAPARLAWRVWLHEGRSTQGTGMCPDPLGDSVPAAFARREGGFTILF